MGAVPQDDVGAVPELAQRGDRAAYLRELDAFGGAALQKEAVDAVPVAVAVRLGDQVAEGTGAVGGVQMAEDPDARVAQPPGRLQAVRVGAGPRAGGDIEDDPVQRGAGAGEFAPFGRRYQGCA